MGLAVRDWKGEVADLLGAANKITEADEKNEGQIVDIGSAMSALVKELDAARLADLEPLRKKVAVINDGFKALIGPLKDGLDRLKRFIAEWKLKEIKAQMAEEERIKRERKEEEARRKAAIGAGLEPPPAPAIRELPPPPPANTVRGSFGKAVGRKTWKAECTDMKLVCKAILDGKVPEDVLSFQAQKAVSLARGGMKFDPEEVGIRAWQQQDQSFN